MKTKMYDRISAVSYANKWALTRNPLYYNFDGVGGDCTSFVSQCLYAGCKQMNYSHINGCYYINGNHKSPSWSGVEFLYNFLISNKGLGPHGENVSQSQLNIGDIIQLSFNGLIFEHSLIVVDIQNINDLNKIYIASHTFDSLHKAVNEYSFAKIRFIHIKDVGI